MTENDERLQRIDKSLARQLSNSIARNAALTSEISRLMALLREIYPLMFDGPVREKVRSILDHR